EPFLAMQWIDGETLKARLLRAPLSISETLAVGRTVASALVAAHAQGIVHRDLKPSNLILRDGELDRATIIDLGIVRWSGAATLDDGSATLGTPGYLAPEQARGEIGIDARVDLYSLGAVLFHC